MLTRLVAAVRRLRAKPPEVDTMTPAERTAANWAAIQRKAALAPAKARERAASSKPAGVHIGEERPGCEGECGEDCDACRDLDEAGA